MTAIDERPRQHRSATMRPTSRATPAPAAPPATTSVRPTSTIGCSSRQRRHAASAAHHAPPAAARAACSGLARRRYLTERAPRPSPARRQQRSASLAAIRSRWACRRTATRVPLSAPSSSAAAAAATPASSVPVTTHTGSLTSSLTLGPGSPRSGRCPRRACASTVPRLVEQGDATCRRPRAWRRRRCPRARARSAWPSDSSRSALPRPDEDPQRVWSRSCCRRHRARRPGRGQPSLPATVSQASLCGVARTPRASAAGGRRRRAGTARGTSRRPPGCRR